MANNSVLVVQMARVLAIVHITVGSLLVCFGITDRVLEYFWTGHGCFGIWMGAWMCLAGGLGIPGSRKRQSKSRNAFDLMDLSIVSAVFGGAIIVVYSLGLATYEDWLREEGYLHTGGYYSPTKSIRWWRLVRGHYDHNMDDYDANKRYEPGMAVMGLLLILGLAELVTGIWVAVCLSLMKPCTCCYDTPPSIPQGRMIYNSDTAGCTMYAPVGCAWTSCPVHGGGGMAAMQTVTPVSQQHPPGVVLVPVSVSGALSYPPQLAHVSTPETVANVYKPPQDDMPQSSSHGGYIRLTNEQA